MNRTRQAMLEVVAFGADATIAGVVLFFVMLAIASDPEALSKSHMHLRFRWAMCVALAGAWLPIISVVLDGAPRVVLGDVWPSERTTAWEQAFVDMSTGLHETRYDPAAASLCMHMFYAVAVSTLAALALFSADP